MSILDQYSFSRSLSVLSSPSLVSLLSCSLCTKPLSTTQALSSGKCPHAICQDCLSSHPGGNCPVEGCTIPAHTKDYKENRTLGQLARCLGNIKSLMENKEVLTEVGQCNNIKDVVKEEPSAKPEKKKAVKKPSVDGKTKSVLKEVALAPTKPKDKPTLGQDEETVGAKTEDKKAASTKPEGKKATTPKPDDRKATAAKPDDRKATTDKPEVKKAATKQQNKTTNLVKSEEEKIVGASSVDQEVTAAKPKWKKDARDKPEDKEAAGARANEQKTSFTKPEEIKADYDKKPAGKKQTRLSLPEGKKNKKGRVRAATTTGQTVSSISTSLNQSTSTGLSSLGKKNTKGETLLHAACSKGCLATVETLLSQGATPNTQDHAGWTPLHEAASAGRVDLAKLLLEAGARPSVPSQDDRITALHDAVGSGQMEMVKLLVSMGADKDARDSKGRTPRDMATIMGTNMVDTIENTVVKVQEKDIREIILQPQEMVLCLSKKVAANNKLVKALVEAAVELGCKRPSPQLKEDMTHLLVEKGEEQDNIEYYTALVVGAEIVSTSWIEESRKEGKLTSCNQFRCEGRWEEGAGISRVRRVSKQPGLLAGIHFYLTGVFESPSLTRVEVQQIVKMAGGKLITREPDPEFIPPREATVPHHAASSSSLASTSHVILYMAGGRKEPQLKYNMKHVKTLPVSWLVACVTSGRVVEL